MRWTWLILWVQVWVLFGILAGALISQLDPWHVHGYLMLGAMGSLVIGAYAIQSK